MTEEDHSPQTAGDEANEKVPSDTTTALDEAVEVSEVGADETDAKDETTEVKEEIENVEVESSSQGGEDVEDALDVSKTTSELSTELGEEKVAAASQTTKDGKDEATEVAEVGASTGEDVDISDEDKEMIKNMFDHFDSDKSGKMSIAELGNFMRAIGERECG